MNEDEGDEIIDDGVIMKCIAKWHPSHKQYSQIELIGLELKALRDAIINRSKHG
jgi:hypothetical protein